MPPRLTAIICTYNRYPLLAGAITSLLGQTLDAGQVEIIIVDNSPDQAKANAFGESYRNIPRLKYIWEPAPGLSNARNIGLERAQAPIAGFIDDDAIAGPGWAQAIIDGFAAFGGSAGAIGGPVRPRWLTRQPSWLGDDLLHCLAIIDWGAEMREMTPYCGLVGCNMALDRQAALRAGGFSRHLGRMGPETTLLSNEEPALFARLHQAGLAIVYTPHAVVEHLISPDRLTQSWFLRRAAWQAVSDFIMQPEKFLTLPSGTLRALPGRVKKAGEQNFPDAAAFSAAWMASYQATLHALAGETLPLKYNADDSLKYRAAALRGRIFALSQKYKTTARLGQLGRQSYRRLTGR